MSKLKAREPDVVKPGHSKAMIFGASGAGKTWFALNFPAPFFIDTEGGAHLAHYMKKLKAAGGAYLGPEDGACDFDVILDQVKALSTEEHQYKTLIIDSITKVFQSSIAKESERLADKDVYGASKKSGISYQRRLLNWIQRLDMNVWFVAHSIEEWKNVNGERKSAGYKPDAWDKLKYELDLALFIENPAPGLRYAVVDKSRLLGFPEYDRFPIQDNGKDLGYAEFAKRYGKDYLEAQPIPIQLCSREQVAEIERIVSILKIEESEIEKWLGKVNAENYSDLSSDQAEKFTKFLKKKIDGEEKKNA